MNMFDSPEDKSVDQWLRQRHESLVADLAQIIDTEAGLRDATLETAHTAFVASLNIALDTDAGLAAVLPDDDPKTPGPSPTAAPATSADQKLRWGWLRWRRGSRRRRKDEEGDPSPGAEPATPAAEPPRPAPAGGPSLAEEAATAREEEEE